MAKQNVFQDLEPEGAPRGHVLTGPENRSAVWAAQRVRDNEVCTSQWRALDGFV